MKVVVVGGGVIGLAQAYDLASNGVEVTVLDAREPGLGASAVNAGWVVPALASPVPAPGVVLQALRWMLRPDSPLHVHPSLDPGSLAFLLGMWRHSNVRDFRRGFEAQLRLAAAATDQFEAYRRDGIDFEVHRDGLSMVYLSAAKLEHQLDHLDVTASFGIGAEVLDGDAIRDHEPALSDAVAGGLVFPSQLHLDPVSLVRGLRVRCEELGVRMLAGCPVEGLERRGRVAVAALADGARHAADAFVLAAGAWTGPLSARLGVPLPVRPGKGYAVDLAPAPLRLRSMVALGEAKVAVTPLDDRLRLAGTMEFGPLDERISAVRVAAIRRAPAAYFRGWSDSGAEAVVGAGARAMTPDGLPVVGRLDPYTNVHVSSGHGMMGVTMAPASARALTSVVLGGELPPQLLAFRTARFRTRGLAGRHRGPSAPAS